MATCFRKGGWSVVASEALPSSTSPSGSYGGTFGGVRDHVKVLPLDHSFWTDVGF